MTTHEPTGAAAFEPVMPGEHRPRRVRFKHPVRVTTVDGEARAWRTLAANLSRDGLFVRMPQPLEPGTRVAISLEAQGQVLPFMEGEVRWCRYQASELDGRYQGIGVRFSTPLHPRAVELVNYLVDTLETGKPLLAAPRHRRRRWMGWGGAAGLLVALSTVVLVWAWPRPAPVLPTPSEGPGPLEVLSAIPQAQEALAAMVAPAEDDVALPRGDERAPDTVQVAPAAEVVEPSAGGEVAPAPILDQVNQADEVAPQPGAAQARGPATGVDGLDGEEATRRGADAPAAPSVDAPAGATAASTEGAQGQLSLPTGAALALQWRPSPDGLDVRPSLRADAHVARVFALSSPPRVVFDIEGAAPRKSHTATPGDDALVSRVRLGKQGARTRVVVDLSSEPRRVITAGDHAIVQF
ncbi:MAG: PilZ domain-containing protein [Myxococcaceae bacterium]|nr:PilZ domain-containing protein [Myxococcaceae bacterium]